MAEINCKEIEDIVRKAIKEGYKTIYEEATKEIFCLIFQRLDQCMLIGHEEKQLENYDVIKTDLEVNFIELRNKILEKLNC